MSIRTKIIAFLAVVCAVYTVCVYIVLEKSISTTFENLQTGVASKRADRTMRTIESELDGLRRITFDYSSWNSTYQFVQGLFDDYATVNLIPSALDNLDLSMILIYDTSGKIKDYQIIDENIDSIPVEDVLIKPLTQSDLLLTHSSLESHTEGLFMTRIGLMLISSQPILTAPSQGPIAGTMVFGRLLNDDRVDSIRRQIDVEFNLYDLPDQSSRSNLSVLSKNSFPFVSETRFKRTSSHIHVYSSLLDVYGLPIAEARTSTPRTISSLGNQTKYLVYGAMLLAGFTFLIAIWLLFENIVITPLLRLTDHVVRLRKSGDLSQRIEIISKNEIGRLGGQFNSLVEQLETVTGELTDSRDRALELSKAKSEFLATMSHEIRTPMNGVLGMTELLLSTELTSKQKKFANTIRSSGEMLLLVINDILDFSKIEAGKLDLDDAAFDAHELIEDLGQIFAEQAYGKGLELICEIDASFTSHVRGDPGRLRQVMTNLVGNAIKFTDSGEVVVSVRCVEEADSTVILLFEVVDTGIGISSESKQKIFESFSQVDCSTRRSHGGTGLGLAISKQLVELMGGHLKVDSVLNEGSTFWFTLQLQKVSELQTDKYNQYAPLSGFRMLIVDDNRSNREVLMHQLSTINVHRECAESGAEALLKLRDAVRKGAPFDVAILDFHMPEMDGLTLARAVKSEQAISHCRLVMLSSVHQCHEVETLREIGIVSYLTKPVRQFELYNCLVAELLAEPSDYITNSTEILDQINHDLRINARILLAEDNRVNQEVAVGMLENFGQRVDVARNGQETLDALARTRYDLVLMDCHMPVMDGIEATKEIRRREREEAKQSRIPVIALTANALKNDREMYLAAGMDDYLSKPISAAQLKQMLQKWLSIKDNVSQPENSNSKQKTCTGLSPTMLDNDSEIIDVKALDMIREQQRDGHSDLLQKMITFYIEDSPPLLETLREAVRCRNAKMIFQTAHSLKSSSAYLGGRNVATLCQQLEAMSRAENIDKAKETLEKIEIAYVRFCEAITAINEPEVA